ncbi:trehalose-6-phosphate synthase [Phyllobacterium salinisoli]|uniref:Trehalose-6-phosphate synthase n=1 Tax=Phyllobacterium salinisoli TaxID=1899321 RepID=A0A368K781_9HYPH|nr:trehalose-6-phosphate synthase [Phyllobacterium salinisoli]RCS25248.1 trehalose-6-phosphate synthase [Phyllobacterium salinisoli]
MERLVIISNRVAEIGEKTQIGGLAVGIADALSRGEGLWVGWNGAVSGPGEDPATSRKQHEAITTLTFSLTEEEHENYYLGFSNRVLWPSFHYRLDLIEFSEAFAKAYSSVNKRFARTAFPELKSDDLVWVHDYHLIPVAQELRKLGSRHRIGFFLHIPFPSAEIFSAVPRHEWLRECLFQFDLIGFQTNRDLENFRLYLAEHADVEFISDNLIKAAGRIIRLGAFPIGIDVEQFAAMANKVDDAVELERMRRDILGRIQMISADRLDYSKGLPERTRAFLEFLNAYPEYRGFAEYLQIASPTREDVLAYTEIRTELEQLSGAVNGKFAEFNWSPVQYINRSIPRDKLACLFHASRIGLITPLRDGMNLVAKEYIAAQPADDPGVLILSKFAGAAEQLEEALIVNPYDAGEVAGAIRRAVTMPLEERQNRQRKLLDRIKTTDAHWWQTTFLEALGHAPYVSTQSTQSTKAAKIVRIR